MKCYSRLVPACAIGTLLIGGLAFAADGQHVITAQDPMAMLGRGSQGYLGIVCGDVDNGRAAALKLKDPTGAEVLNVDRDAPAAKAGLRAHDVILQMNGETVAGEEQLRRMLRETPAGRTVNLLISRDGRTQTMTVQLGDRAILEQGAWVNHTVVPAPDDDQDFGLEGPSGHGPGAGNGFFGTFSLGSPSVGVDLDVLGSQLADYFGVKDGQGLLVKHVADNSPASRAGLKAGDVITKANGQTMATLNEWMKMLHANRGKPVEVTLMRNHKEETVTLEAAAGKSHGELIMPDSPTFAGNPDLIAELAQLNDQCDPDTIREDPESAMSVSDWQKIQKQLNDERQKADEQAQQLQNQFESMTLRDEME